MGPGKEHASRAAAALCLADMPPEVIERMLASVSELPTLLAANATARLFRGAPGGRSPVEHALRALARARGLERAIPTALPPAACTWTAELLALLRTHELARAHAAVVACSRLTWNRYHHGPAFSAFADAEGGLHTCGEVPARDASGELTGEHVAPVALGHADMPVVTLPKRVVSLAAVRVVAVAAGAYHLLALSDAGAVYGCGGNGCGQLGLGDGVHYGSGRLERVRALAQEHAVCIAAGEFHSLALTAAGGAYSWGGNNHGQLGHGDRDGRWAPKRIEALGGVRVGGASAGAYHTLLASLDGAVFSCGHGACGELGHGDDSGQDQLTPRRIEALAGVRAVHVSAGDTHSLALDAEGGVHSFGRGTAGCLGHGDTALQPVPRRVDALAGVRAVRASCGLDGSAVLGADGSAHAFGSNAHGTLGLGGATRSLLPARVQVEAGARVVGCALGGQHALYVTADGAAHACGWRSAALGLGVRAAPEADMRTPTRVARLQLLWQGQQGLGPGRYERSLLM